MNLSEKDRWLVRSSLLVAAEHYDELSLRCDQPTVLQERFQQQAADARRIADAIEEVDDHLGRTAGASRRSFWGRQYPSEPSAERNDHKRATERHRRDTAEAAGGRSWDVNTSHA